MYGKKEMIVKLQSMGFTDENVEKAFCHTSVSSIEEAMYYFIPTLDGYYEHKFVHDSHINTGQYCLLCKRNQNLQVKQDSQLKMNPKKYSHSPSKFSKFNDLEAGIANKTLLPEPEIKLSNKLIRNNQAYLNLYNAKKGPESAISS